MQCNAMQRNATQREREAEWNSCLQTHERGSMQSLPPQKTGSLPYEALLGIAIQYNTIQYNTIQYTATQYTK
jgi:hypothetical protein